MKTSDTKINVGTILRKKDTDRLYPVIKVYGNGDVDVLGDGTISTKILKENVEKAFSIAELPNNESTNHPKHYNRDNAMECIDEMLLVFGKWDVLTFCRLNVWKYRYRAADKGGMEDIRKSDWYMQLYKRLLNEDNNE